MKEERETGQQCAESLVNVMSALKLQRSVSVLAL